MLLYSYSSDLINNNASFTLLYLYKVLSLKSCVYKNSYTILHHITSRLHCSITCRAPLLKVAVSLSSAAPSVKPAPSAIGGSDYATPTYHHIAWVCSYFCSSGFVNRSPLHTHTQYVGAVLTAARSKDHCHAGSKWMLIETCPLPPRPPFITTNTDTHTHTHTHTDSWSMYSRRKT